MKKRLLSIIISAVFIISCFGTGVYAAETEADRIPELLTAFNLIPASQRGQDVTEEVTRGELADMAAILLGNGVVTNNSTQPFRDVPPDSPYYESVMRLYDCGYVEGTGNSSFNPEDKIEYLHAATILLKIMGYDNPELLGKTYAGLAAEQKFYKGMTFDSKYLTRENAFKMIYRALTGTMIYNSWYYSKENMTLLEDRFHIYSVTGIVTNDGRTSYSGKTTIAESSVMIDDTVYINKADSNPTLGTEITAYYVDNDGDYEIRYYYENKTNSVKEYGADDIISYDGKYTYEVYRDENQEKTEKIFLDAAYKIIYNGVAYVPEEDISSKDFINMLKPLHGSVRFIDNNRDNKYDIVLVTNYELIIVGGVDRVNKIIYNKNNTENKIEIDKIDEATIFDANDRSREMAIERIVADNIIYAAISYDKSYAQILVSNKTVTGKYDKKTSDEIVMGEEIYKFSEEYKEFIKTNPISDVRETVYYLSPENEIVFHKLNPGDNDLSFAFLYEIIRGDDESTGEECLMARVYTHDNEYKTVKLADAVTVDGIRYKKNKKDVIYNLIKRHKYGEGSMIAVKYNSDNEIKFIDMAYNPEDNDIDDVTGKSYRYPNSGEGNDSLHIANGITGYTAPENYRDPQKFKVYGVNSGMIGNGELAMSTDTLVFYIPLGDNREDSFVTHTTDITYDKEGGINFSVTAYAMKDNALVADVITINNRYCVGTDLREYASAAASHTYIVSEVNEELNRFDEPSTHLKLYYNRNYYDFYTTREGVADRAYCGLDASGNIYYKSVEPGDVVKVGTDKYGDIPEGQIRIMYSPSYDSDKIIYSNPSFNPSSAPQANDLINRVWINRIDGKYIEFATESPIVNTNLPRSKKYIATTGRPDYVVYENGKVKLGDATQLVSYEQTKSEDCRVITIGGLSKIQVIYTIK